MTTADTPLFLQVLRMYGKWSTRALVYITVFFLSVGTALLLDHGFGIQPARVVLYVLALTAVLMLAVPAGFVALRRSRLVEHIDSLLSKALPKTAVYQKRSEHSRQL